MKSWITEISQRQAMLVLLLNNKKDTPNLVRFRPVLLQVIKKSSSINAVYKCPQFWMKGLQHDVVVEWALVFPLVHVGRRFHTMVQIFLFNENIVCMYLDSFLHDVFLQAFSHYLSFA